MLKNPSLSVPRTMRMLALCGAAGGLAAAASGAPTVVHMSGATLLQNFAKSRAATVDFIDVDGDGIARGIPNSGSTIDQLAPFFYPGAEGTAPFAGQPANMHLAFFYSSVGSGSGLLELIENGRGWNTGNSANSFMPISRRTNAYFNRYNYIVGGNGFDDNNNPDDLPGSNNFVNPGNAGGMVFRSVRDDIVANPSADFAAAFSFPPLPSTSGDGLTTGSTMIPDVAGATVDIGILDVPAAYFLRSTGTTMSPPVPLSTPGAVGYGDNNRVPRSRAGAALGSPTASRLTSTTVNPASPSGVAGVATVNINTVAPDANTIFDTPLFFAPIAPVANFGVGMQGIGSKQGIRLSEIQHLFITGRMPSGENLVAVTRDAGSGTRNGFNNSTGVDPSWGVGDNVGNRSSSLGQGSGDAAGPNFIPSNKGGNPNVEETVYNSRLAIGYVGPERGLANSGNDVPWLAAGFMDILSVANDLPDYGSSTTFVRPTLSAILNNDQVDTRWVIGGPAALSTFGNPAAAPATKGGAGWLEPFQDIGPDAIAGTMDAGEGDGLYQVGEPFNDVNGDMTRNAVESRPAAYDAPGYPKMRNVEAAAFINNITRSIQAFEDVPEGGDPLFTFFTPGEFAALNFILNGALPRVQSLSDPTTLVPNPEFNAGLQQFILTLNPPNIQANAAYAAFGTGVAPSTVIPGATSNSPAGKVPTRAAGTYSDGNTGNHYVTLSGATLDYGTTAPGLGSVGTFGNELPLANMIAGDFNQDGVRNMNDAEDLVGAYRRRYHSGTWMPPAATGALAALAASSGFPANPGDFVIEIVGDFDASGSFDAADVRFWADGLAIDPGTSRLDRLEGFTRIDEASEAAGGSVNFFGTIIGNGATVNDSINTYAAGYAAADIAGSGGEARGWAPVGADGRVNGADIDYVVAQLTARNQTGSLAIDGGEIDWATELDEAALTDLSADVNGDLVISMADADYIITTVLCTNRGDRNLDGAVDAADLAGLPGSFGGAATWAQGDANSDGVYTQADLDLITANQGASRPCDVGGPTDCEIADFDSSGSVDATDIFVFLDAWFSQNGQSGRSLSADVNGSGGVDATDIFVYLDKWFANNGQSC